MNFDPLETGAAVGADVDGRTRPLGEFLVAGNEIGVKMRLKDVTNADVLFFRGLEINIYVALWVDDDRLAFRGQHVRCVGQTAQVKLLEIHRCLLRELCLS
jgi:hypothetical protein